MSKQIEAITNLLEKFPISAWIIDTDQNIIYMNRIMRELFGDLAGNKTSIVYDCGSFEIVQQKNDESEVVISDVPFRHISSEVDLGEDGVFGIEFFEDISEQKLTYSKMSQVLAKLNAEIQIAKTIQNSILPIDNIYWNTMAFSSLYMPADDLGGDFYDLLKLSDDEYLIYIADVSGHGIQASLLTIFMRERVRTNMESALTGTGELLSKLVHDFSALEIDETVYVTMTFCKYNKSKRELTISNAGLNCYPIVVRNNGRMETVPTHGMPVCALADGLDYDEEVISINPGDRLILFTDGVVEEVDSMTGAALGSEGVRRIAGEYHDFNGSYLAHKIMEESDRYTLISARDDRSIVVVDILS